MPTDAVTILVVLYLLPVPLTLWASWRIWRLGGQSPRPRALRDALLPGTCRICGAAGEVHRKTGRCDPCHGLPLPGPEAVPDALPEDVRLPVE